MPRRLRPRPPQRSGLWAVALVCLLFLGFGIYTILRGLYAIDQGAPVPGTPRYGPMSGATAIIIGASSVLAGGFGLWLIARGKQRKK